VSDTAVATIENRTFEVRQPVDPIHGWTANERWTYTDKAGHVHRYDDRYEPLTGTCYPTLLRRSEHVPCDDWECGCDGHDREWYVCHLCDQVIRPSVRPATWYRALRAEYFVDGRPVTRAEYETELVLFLALVAAQEVSHPCPPTPSTPR
jgi:hypothetical protein